MQLIHESLHTRREPQPQLENMSDSTLDKIAAIKKALATPAPRRPNFFKIYGERNTGTNFLSELIRSNINLEEITQHAGSAETKKNLESLLTITPTAPLHSRKLIKNIYTQRAIDADRDLNMSKELGWKHGCIDYQFLSQYSRFHETVFILLTRNPWSFLLSLFRKPYNIIPAPRQSHSFSDFLRSPILCNARDRVGGKAILDTPARLWPLKVESYHKFAKESPIQNSILFNYESVVSNPGSALNKVAGLAKRKRRKEILIPQSSSKNDDRTFADFQKAVFTFDPMLNMSREDALFIQEIATIELLEKTGYQSLT